MRHPLRLCVAVAPVVALCLAFSSTAVLPSARSAAAPALAAITVNSTADVVANGDGLCTLREALAAAANDAPSGAAAGECAAGSGDDTININVTGTIELTDVLTTTTNVSIIGPGSGQLTLRSVGTPHRIFFVNVSTVSISGMTMTGGGFNPGGGSGGALNNGGIMTLTDVVLTDNHTAGGSVSEPDGGSGGAIYNFGALTMINCVVSGNSTASGMVGNSRNGAGGRGGGIDSGTGTLTLINTVISGNSTGGGPGGAGPGVGIFAGNSLTLINSTVSGNTTVGDGDGGGIYATSAPLKLTNSTITANSGFGVITGGGGMFGNTATVVNTIIAGNGGPDVSGAFSSQGHNLIGIVGTATGFNGPGDIVGTSGSPVNPRLGPLANNGGTTQTHALLAGSPALDAGDNTLARDASNNPLTTDQRGQPRLADSADADTLQVVDIGSFEANPSVEDIADKTTGRNVPLSFSFNVGDAVHGIASVTATSSNTTLVPNDPSNVSVTGTGSTRTLQLTPAAGQLGTSTITVTVTGTNGQSMSDTFVLTVVPVNQAPTLDAIGDLTINEDAGTQTVNLSGISAGPGETQALTITATSSDTTLIPHPAVTYTSPNATGSISFAPAANRSGTAVITVTVTDDGGTAGGGVNTFSRTFQVTVTAVNDAPVNTVPGAQATAQHTPVVFSAANSNAISVADIDAGADAIRVTLTATNGTVTLGSNAGLTFVTGDGTEDASVSFNGTLAAVNAALAGLSFKPAQGFSGAASLQIITDDQGRNGSGGALTDTDSVTINVASGGTLQLSAATYQTVEGGLVTTVTVTRTGGSAGTASVNYATSAGTAAGGAACGAGVDFINASGTLNWNDGETASKTFNVILCDDSSHESDETVNVTLSGAGGSATLGTQAAAVLTIQDDDPAGGRIQFLGDTGAAEGAGAMTVTVTRTGDTSLAVSVDYATDDGSVPSVPVPCSSTTGLALDRCDYTKALGTLSFAAGETEKTFKVLISDDSFVEGLETATLRLSNASGGAVLGGRNTATFQIVDDSTESPGNTIDDPTKFVIQHYHDFLNREPDPDGLAFWVSGITVCGADAGCREVKRIDTSAAFFLSIEFQNTGYLVYRTYKAAYGDATSPNVPGTVPVIRLNEFLPDTQRIGRDVIVNQGNWEQTLEANKQAYALEFVRRQRFLAAFPASMTAAEFVDKLDQNAGGVLSADERAQLVASLGATPSDAAKRAAVLRQVAEHQTLREREFNRAFVLMEYFGYLRRNPDDAPEPGLNFAGWKFWLDKLEEFGGDYRRAEMVKAFISSDEYRQRFGRQ